MTGERLGGYTIDRELGSGGMGKVYAATGPDGVVALKVVHAHLLETPGFFKRFLREAQLGQSIRHENVVRTLDCDQDFTGGKPQCFLVMEYVEGQTLSELLRELERVPEELCRHVAREVCKGLAAVHEAGVVHRDLKPENVLITPEHVVKVMDLGVAQVADEALRLSRSGAFVGSVEYAAPEQFKGGDVDGRTDLHALGVLLYELSSGVHPYRGGSFHEVLGRVCDEEPRRLGEINPQLSAYFEEMVHTLLVKDPRGRFTSATQLIGVLEEGEDSSWWHERARSLQAETKQPIRRIHIPRETAVYGRDGELATLRALYEQAKEGAGRIVLIEGEAGIGKSRLVDELVARLHSDGEEISFLFGSYPPGGAATAAGGFSAAFREQLGEAGSADYLTQVPSLVPAFDALLRGEPAPSDATTLSRDAIGTCFVHATRNLAAERTTVVLIDDLHFAPEEARSLFMALAQAVPFHRVLLIGTTRPGLSGDWIANLTRLDHASRIDLPRLGAKDLGLLLQDTFRSKELARSLGMQIAMKSDGNPFFAFEIVRGLREGQFITQRDDGTWASTQVIEDIEIPSSVLDLVNARVADLEDEEKDLLEVAACCGYQFDPALVAEVCDVAPIPALKRLGRVEQRHRLIRSAGRAYAFDHHQVQEALYQGLHETLREHYHAAIGAALERRARAADADVATLEGDLCVALCEHYLKGGRGESAVRYLAHAQAHLEKSYLYAPSAALGERALAVPGLLTGRERAKHALRLAAANGPYDLLWRRKPQEVWAREADRLADELGDEELRGEAAHALGNVLWRTACHDEAEAAYRRAREIARARGDRRREAVSRIGLGNVCKLTGRLDEACEHYRRGLALAREAGHVYGETIATGNLGGTLGVLGRASEAIEHHERAGALAREAGNRRLEAIETGNLGVAFWSQGRLREARECFERAIDLQREIGDRQGEALNVGNLGTVLRALGHPSAADELHERALALSREVGDRDGEAHALGNVAGGLGGKGRIAEARRLREQELAICREIGHRHGEASALVNIGPTSHLLGEPERARRAYEESIALCREQGIRFVEGYGLAGLAVLAQDEGDTDRARELAEEALALRREIQDGNGVAQALVQLGEIALDERRPDAARAVLEEALTLAREQEQPQTVASALCVAARLPGGDVEAARAALATYTDASTLQRRHFELWEASGDRADLQAAAQALEDLLERNPPEHHEAMRTNVRVHREILAARREERGDAGDAPTESPTRVG